MSGVEKEGLLKSVIVRPLADGKYEIICSHNGVRTMESWEIDHNDKRRENISCHLR